jgi:hypothetical protein
VVQVVPWKFPVQDAHSMAPLEVQEPAPRGAPPEQEQTLATQVLPLAW